MRSAAGELYELVADAWWASLTDAEREEILRRAAASGQKRIVRAAREMAEHMRQAPRSADDGRSTT